MRRGARAEIVRRRKGRVQAVVLTAETTIRRRSKGSERVQVPVLVHELADRLRSWLLQLNKQRFIFHMNEVN